MRAHAGGEASLGTPTSPLAYGAAGAVLVATVALQPRIGALALASAPVS